MSNLKKNNRGQILVLVAFSLIVIIGFAALAIDIGYFYHVKNQLQGAADAAALAGASQLDGSLSQIVNAKNEAVKYAGLNIAAGSAVQVSNDGTNILTSSNDITVGLWSSLTNTYTPGITPPVNAIQVKARRTSDAPGRGVDRMFGRIFRSDQQDISATAIATAVTSSMTPTISVRLVN